MHIFVNRLKCLLREKENIFWTMAFPLILAIMFNLAFSNLNKGETFQTIELAVVNNADWQQESYLKTALEEASAGNTKLFNLTFTSQSEAENLLQQNAVDGYLEVTAKQLKLIVNDSGIKQSIIKSFLDSYLQTAATVNTILENKPQKPEQLLHSTGERRQYVREVSGTAAEPNSILNYFYSLIAMACFFGGFLGLNEITRIEANLSPLAARINIAPVHKLKAFFSSFSASLLLHLAEMFILLLFLRYVLKIDFGPKSFYVVLTTIVGSITGLSFGAFISVLVKKAENMKIAILVAATMTGSFLAGMMYAEMKYLVAKHLPLLAYLNPLNLLTDAYYSLYYYDTLTRYLQNLGILISFALLFCLGTYFMIRRRKYASL
ncbi:MAG: ABC transporter permease [Firmicutes bacterium]|nr:ABC transporter permease [Bacillota bacterium]